MLEEEERPSESGPASPAEASPSTDPAQRWSEDDDSGTEGDARAATDDGVPLARTHAGQLLALRESLTEKELQLLEMQQAQIGALNARDEAMAAAEQVSSKMREMRAELKAAREAAETARAESSEYREKWMEEKRASATAEAVAEKAQELVAACREERAEARNERDAARSEASDKALEAATLRGMLETASREAESIRAWSREATAKLEEEVAATKAEVSAAREAAEKSAQRAEEAKADRGQARDEAHARAMELLKKTTDERVSEAHAQVAEARAEAAEHARVAGEAVSKALAVAQVQAELKVRTAELTDRVKETQRHAEGRTAAAKRHKEAARELKRQLAEAQAALARAAAARDAPVVDPSARNAVREASSVLSGAMKRCFDAELGDDSEMLKKWLAGGGEGDVDGSALLAVAHRVAGALLAVRTRAEDAESVAEKATNELEDLRLELTALHAERQAALAAMEREKSVASGWENAATRAESSLAAVREELRALQSSTAAADEKGNLEEDDLAAKMSRLNEWDRQKSQLDKVIQRMANRSLESFEGGESAEGNDRKTLHRGGGMKPARKR